MSKQYEISLSLNKFLSILTKNEFTPVSLYCLPEKVGFLEVRTPKLQKTFIISVPEKYRMKIDTEMHRIVSILEQDDEDTLDIEEVKGPLLTCDLVFISETLSHYLHNGTVCNYSFGEKKVENISEESDQDVIEKLEMETNKIAKKLKIKITDTEEMKDIEEGEDEEEEEEEEEDEDGEEEKEEINETKSLQKKDIEKSPENITLFNEDPIDIGMVYVSISLDTFYKEIKQNIGDIESDIAKSYDILDDNVNEINERKSLTILDLTKKLNDLIKLRNEEFKKSKVDCKVQSQKLVFVLENLDKLIDKMIKNPQKYEKELIETNSLLTQTKTTLHEINVEKMRSQENLNSYLNSMIFSLNDMLNM